jgi:cell division protein FtsQ
MRKNRRRGSGLRARLARTLGIASVAAVVLGLGTVSVRVGRSAMSHPYFSAREIVIEGAREPATVLAWAGLEQGMSLWSVDPGRTAERLLAHARIRRAAVHLQFPNRIEISVEERRAVAVLMLDRPLLLDPDGVAFPPLGSDHADGLPYVTGLRMKDLGDLPEWKGLRLRQVTRLISLWQRHAEWPELSELRPEPTGEIVVYPMGSPMAIRFGRELREESFARLSAVFGQWEGRQSQVSAVDLSVPGQVVLRLRKGALAAGRKAGI